MPTQSFSDKHQLRSLMRKMRKEHPAKERQEKSCLICKKLVASLEFQKAKTILLYCPKPDEVDTWAAITAALVQQKTVCLPRTDEQKKEIRTYRISGSEKLEKAVYGIFEPVADESKKIHPEKIDLIIVPGVAFDIHCNRVGHGLGYYDKFLAAARNACKVAVAFDFQVVDEKIVCESHDVTVDQIITEKRHIVIRK